ncbi:MAG TPA: cytochrome c biogenesis protein CcsA [Chitinophagaceae bacterium]|nr:cytochrome c biogenesis protein CcsA [Chitinophagaceae bacterium]
MNYTGEHLLPGQLGHFAVILSLVASLVATIAFFKASKVNNAAEKQSWLRLARGVFLVETISVITIIACIYYILTNHLFEYNYAWEHSDKTLQTKYVFACLWEGQEGSFLLWAFWHCVLGWILIFTAKKWEAGVLTAVSFAQFCIATMMLGLYVQGQKIGNNPFLLLRHEGMLTPANAPMLFDENGALRQDYLVSYIRDGSGLNALLQNYWMVIHPPILFLGFASTIVPFSFAFAGLVNKDHSWVKPVLPWAGFSGAVLCTGIMMGAAWAYESLSFAGYWAWDPVENASLVPWLVMVAGLHTNIIYRNSGYSLKSTYVFYLLSFLLILYSTFLTRSGILGDTSVHAFVGADMTPQLYLFVAVFAWFVPVMAARKTGTKWLYVGLFVITTLMAQFVASIFTLASIIGAVVCIVIEINKTNIPAVKKEENTYSREFWMFIGALVLFLAAIVIITQTSIPVFNKWKNSISFLKSKFPNDIGNPEDPQFFYNQIQIFIAIILGLLTAVTQYFRYKDTPKAFFGRKIWIPTLTALVLSLAISLSGYMNYDKKGPGFMIAIQVALFGAIYAIIANAGYIWLGMKGRIKAAGASVAHVGFGMLLLGVLISSSKKEVLSWNTTGIALFEKTKDQDPAENLTLFQGIKTDMGKYDVTYVRDTVNNVDRMKYFELKFDSKNGNEHFNIYPDVLRATKGQQGFAFNPDKKHYWNKDLFVYVSSFQGGSVQHDTSTFRPIEIREGDTIFYSNGMILLNGVQVNPHSDTRFNDGEMAMVLDMTVISKQGSRFTLKPGIAIKGNSFRNLPDTVLSQGLIVQFNKVADEKNRILEVGIKENKEMTPVLTLKVYQFPYINLVWLSVVIMVTGFIMSVVQRVKKDKAATTTVRQMVHTQ